MRMRHRRVVMGMGNRDGDRWGIIIIKIMLIIYFIF